MDGLGGFVWSQHWRGGVGGSVAGFLVSGMLETTEWVGGSVRCCVIVAIGADDEERVKQETKCYLEEIHRVWRQREVR